MRKPANLVYAVDERPPPLVTFLSALQLVAVVGTSIVFPLLVFRSAGLSTGVVANLLSIGFIVLGIGTLLQASSRGPVGSGYLCPSTFTATFIGPGLAAVSTGGLSLLFGMTLFSGVVQSALSRALALLRPFLPAEISGFVVLMVGVTAGFAGLRYMTAPAGAPPATPLEWTVAVATLLLMAGLSVWSTGMLRMTCALVGLVAGYAACALLGLTAADIAALLAGTPAFALPATDSLQWRFDGALLVPFTVAALATTLKATGTVTLCQRVNDADWVRPDMGAIRGGVLADGLAIALAGAAGTFGVNTSPASVALSSATGVASRQVAWVVGALFIALGFLPKVATLLATMPRAVMTAALVFATCFLLVNGMQMITSRMLDTRKTLVIGLAMIAGLAVEVFPSAATAAPVVLAPLMGSSLVFGTVVALALNLVSRIGVRQTVRMDIVPTEDWAARVQAFYKKHGGAWGARPDVMARAEFATLQCVEAVAEHCAPRAPLRLDASFDEFSLDLRLTYDGERLEFPDARPSAEQIRGSAEGLRRLAGFMLKRNADRIAVHGHADGVSLHFHFDH